MNPKLVRLLVLAATCGALVPAAQAAAPTHNRFLTGPQEGLQRDIALDYARAQAGRMGLAAADVEELVVVREYVSRHNEVTHVWLRQAHQGIEVATSELAVHVMPDGRVLHFTGQPVPRLAARVNGTLPALPAEAAIEAAAQWLGLTVSETPRLLSNWGGADLAATFSGAGVSQSDIPVRLMYLPANPHQVRLTWNLSIQTLDGLHWWSVWVDAESGVLLRRDDWVNEDRITALAQPGRNISSGRSETPAGCTAGAAYNVYALPRDSPNDGPRSCESDPQDATASPFGWHDTNGAAGAEFTDTRGNNVFAQEDRDANDTGGFRPNGGAGLDFDFPIDLADPPIDYQSAAITNLFYWNSIIHDVYYQYGFDSASGNFQENTYGQGGLGSDSVNADAQDGSGTNNANFATPPDGSNPRMQMFEWTTPFANLLTINSPGGLGPYFASGANFGPGPTGETGNITYANDGAGVDIHDGCEPFSMGGNAIALINRGNCNFVLKVRNAQNAGADAAIIRKITPGNGITLGDDGTGGDITIPSGMITMADGDEIVVALGGGPVNATFDVNPTPEVNRDSDLDNGIMVHEYTHGLSNRLTGTGPGCLGNAEQAGEGWSDVYALMLTPDPSDVDTTPRGIATYVSYEGPDGLGIRTFQYTTDMGVNPLTYGTLGACAGPPVQPHCVGERWAVTVWEMYWNLVNEYGFDPDLYAGAGGNNLALQLVTDGLKLQPCSPDFVDARDAILAGDVALTGGENACFLWTAFAKRGIGLSANAGSNNVVGDETEAFDLPDLLPDPCAPILFVDGFESGNTSAWSQTVP